MNDHLRELTFKALSILPDKTYISLMYRLKMGKTMNWKDPQTYNEKLQWLKLYDRKPEYVKMVDKYEVKKYVGDIIGEEHIIPTLGVWEQFDDIDFDSLPNSFVLKCTHDSGGLVIVKDKATLDMDSARRKIEKGLNSNYFSYGREWQYKGVKPRIIAEVLLEEPARDDLRDYKIFCFDGQVKALFIASDRNNPTQETRFDFFDENFDHMPFTNGHPNADVLPQKPQCFEEMKILASRLSKGIPHVRVDFYEVNGKVYFGELTFFHWSGMMPFEPEIWDKTFGDWIKLPTI